MKPLVIRFGERRVSLNEGETLLECFERHGLPLPSSCRTGVCQSCMLKATAGEIPESAQVGLKPAWRRQGYLLACRCRPTTTLSLAPCDAAPSFTTRIVRVATLSPAVRGIFLDKPVGLAFEAGQFLQLTRPGDGLTRPYSIASLPSAPCIELHVAIQEKGRMSSWLANARDEQVLVRGPFGECQYFPGSPTEPLLLAGTGTGLSPLLGVARAALVAEHSGPVHLYHGARATSGLYAQAELALLAARHSNLRLRTSVLELDSGEAAGAERGRIEDAVLRDLPRLAGFRVYLCGSPRMVSDLRRRSYLAGASLAAIHADSFVQAPSRASDIPA